MLGSPIIEASFKEVAERSWNAGYKQRFLDGLTGI
jgi:hypothetical protein